MSGTRVDFALIQPLVYSLEPWLTLRKAMPRFLREGAALPPGVAEARIHLAALTDPSFDDRLARVESITDAFSPLLEQTREMPCIVLPLDRPSGSLLANREAWPDGVVLDAASTRFIVPRNGEPLLLHLASGTIDPGAFPGRFLQREIRELHVRAIARDADAVHARLESCIEGLLGERPKERVADALESSGGHLVTLAASADPEVIAVLRGVHLVEEGTAADQRELLYPDRPAEPCWMHLGWSYSTAGIPDPGVRYRLLFPLIAVNQAWYRYRELRGDMIEMSRRIDALETDRELTAQTSFFNQVVLETRIWEAEREAFERGLRPAFRSVYDRLAGYWHTDESRDTVQAGLDSSREFLDRKYSVKTTLRENTQSKILFVIAIFQLLSVFGLVSGYLYFWEKTPLPEQAIFDSRITVWVTLISPIVVLVLIAWLLVSFFRRNR